MFGWLRNILGMNTKTSTSVSTMHKPVVKTPEEIARIRARNLTLMKEVHQRMITEGKLPKYV